MTSGQEASAYNGITNIAGYIKHAAGRIELLPAGGINRFTIADVVGRRTIWIMAGLLTAVYLPVLIYAATPVNVSYLLLMFGFLYGAPYAVNSTYMSESFPTSVRGTAVATANR